MPGPGHRRPANLSGVRAAVGVGVLVCAVAGAAGCGPVEYVSQVWNRAATAVAAAKEAGAEKYAPYEMTAAEEYLHKAREEAGYSEYGAAIDFGRRAEELALHARAVANTERKGITAPGSESPPAAEPAGQRGAGKGGAARGDDDDDAKGPAGGPP